MKQKLVLVDKSFKMGNITKILPCNFYSLYSIRFPDIRNGVCMAYSQPWGYVQEEGDKYRMGALYIGYDNLKIGIDSDKYVRHPIQDEQAHNWDLKLFGKTLLNTQQPGFETLSDDIKPYIQYNSFPIDVKMPNFTLYKDD